MIRIDQSAPVGTLLPFISAANLAAWEAAWLEVAKRFGHPGIGTVENELEQNQWLNLVKEVALRQFAEQRGVDTSSGDLEQAFQVAVRNVTGEDPIGRINYAMTLAAQKWYNDRGQVDPITQYFDQRQQIDDLGGLPVGTVTRWGVTPPNLSAELAAAVGAAATRAAMVPEPALATSFAQTVALENTNSQWASTLQLPAARRNWIIYGAAAAVLLFVLTRGGGE